jgi:hypothetical protein
MWYHPHLSIVVIDTTGPLGLVPMILTLLDGFHFAMTLELICGCCFVRNGLEAALGLSTFNFLFCQRCNKSRSFA